MKRIGIATGTTMMIVLVILLFFVSFLSRASATILEVEEEELIRLAINASDPDGDSLTVRYSSPLNENGSWQTVLGDEGEYNSSIFVQDSSGDGVSQNITLRVLHKNIPPPSADQKVTVRENESLTVILPNESRRGILVAYDIKLPEGAELQENRITWKPSFATVKAKPFFIAPLLHKWGLLKSYSLEQKKTINLSVTGTTENRSTTSTIFVDIINSNRAPVFLDVPKTMTVAEGDALTINYTVNDPDDDKLFIFFSGLIEKNGASIAYEEAGNRSVELKLSDGMVQVPHTVAVTVQNTNRDPTFAQENKYRVEEGTKKSISLMALDPDNDVLHFSLIAGPSFATVENNTLILAPDFETVVTRNKSTSFSMTIMVSDGNLNASKEMKIEVKNRNRAPTISATSPDNKIIVKRGQVLDFSVDAQDLDGDALNYVWSSGFFDKKKGEATHRRKFSEPGVKKFSVTASDDDLSTEHEWKILVR